MGSKTNTHSPQTVVVFTPATWEHVLVNLRVKHPAEYAGMQVLRGNERAKLDPEQISKSDLIVIQREYPRYWQDYELVVHRACAEGKPIIYEIDDLLIDMPEDHSHRRDYLRATTGMLSAILTSDVVTVSSPKLVEYIQEINPNTRILPNYLDDKVWEIKTPLENKSGSNHLVIGYMGGETHLSDVKSISPIILDILRRYPDRVTLKFWGGRPPEELLEVRSTEWTPIFQEDYAEFARFFLQQDCDIFIAPLRDNAFNRAKSAVKYLEYSAMGVPGVYSKLPPYEWVVEHGVNGFLASNLQEWNDYLCQLIESPTLRYQMARQAQQTLRSSWLLSDHCQEWIQVYGEAMALSESTRDRRRTESILNIFRQVENYQETRTSDAESQLQEIFDSRSWRFLRNLQRLRLRLFPRGSRGEKFLFGRGKQS